MSESHRQIQDYMKAHHEASELEAETAILGFSHSQLGRQLAKTWKLPERLADSIGYHHHPDLPNESGNYAFLINLADYVAHQTYPPPKKSGPGRHIQSPSGLDFFGIDDSVIEEMGQQLNEEYAKAKTFMKIAGIG